mgnify:FL=1
MITHETEIEGTKYTVTAQYKRHEMLWTVMITDYDAVEGLPQYDTIYRLPLDWDRGPTKDELELLAMAAAGVRIYAEMQKANCA